MTPSEIAALSNADLDKAIAERLGWTDFEMVKDRWRGYPPQCPRKPYRIGVPKVTRNLYSCFALLETLRGRGWSSVIAMRCDTNCTKDPTGRYVCNLLRQIWNKESRNEDSLPRAIAEACLMALMEETE